MNRAQFWANLVARVTRGAVPIDGIMQPAEHDECKAPPAAQQVPHPRDTLTSESEFDLAIFPKWGNFR